MKLSSFALLTIIGSASAGLPSLSISVKDGSFDGLGGLDPTLSWSDSASAGDVDVEYGIEANAQPTTDIASLPKNIWGKASTNVAGWGVSARAEFQGTDFSDADIDVDISNDDGLSLHVDASSASGVDKVELSKSFDAGDGSVTVNPRYDVASGDTDVVVAYAQDDTSVEVTASADAQSVTVSRQIDDDNRVAPTISSDGDISIEWERSLGDDNSLTATVKPNDSVDLEWKDSAWTANINLPLDGNAVAGANVNIKREVNF